MEVPSTRKRLTFLVLTLLALPLAMELVLVGWAAASPRVATLLGFATDSSVGRHIPDEVLGHRPNPGHPEHDSWGFRNPSVPGRAHVVALGDSQTYGAGCQPGEAWPNVVDREAPYTVYNMSFGGYGAAHSAHLLERALELQPRVVIEAVYAGNDLFDAFYLVRDRGQLAHLLSEDAELSAEIAEAEREGGLVAEVEELFDTGHSRFAWLRILQEHSRLYGLLRAAKRQFAAPVSSSAALRRRAEASGGREVFFEAGELSTVFTPDYRLRALRLDDPRIEDGFQTTLRALEELASRTRGAGAEFLVLLIPTKEFAYRELVERQGGCGEAFAELADFEEQFWGRLIAWLDQQGIRHVDCSERLRLDLARGQQVYRSDSDGHPNASGQQAIAQVVLEAMAGFGVEPSED